jgi:hypothetical protein
MDDSKEHQSVVGSQMYAISRISQSNNSPNDAHYAVAKRVLRYLKGTLHVVITFSGSMGLILKNYCDADWVDGEDGESNISAYIVVLAGGAIA